MLLRAIIIKARVSKTMRHRSHNNWMNKVKHREQDTEERSNHPIGMASVDQALEQDSNIEREGCDVIL